MPVPELKYAPGVVPDRYVAVPISVEQSAASLRVCVLCRVDADPLAGHLVVVRDQLDSRAYLGCVVDQGETGPGGARSGARVHQWVEVWVQTLDALAGSVPAARESLSNAALDERWERQVKAFDRFDRPVIIKTGCESANGKIRPTWLDIAKGEPLSPKDQQSGDTWTLCRDDGLLLRAGLPPYTSTLERYLYLPEVGAETPFVPVTATAPMNGRCKPLKEIAPKASNGQPGAAFNPGAGLLMVRHYAHMRFESYVDLLAGAGWTGVWHGTSQVDIDHSVKKPTSGIWTPQQLAQGGAPQTNILSEGGLFLGQQGKYGRVTESLHLKLRAVADVLLAARSFSLETQRPLLNLRPESLQVRLGEPAPGLPYLWTTRVALADPGDAVALPIKTSDAVYYVAATPGASIYRSQSAGHGTTVRGKATLRIRQVLTQPGEEMILEATFATDERISIGKNDLVWLRINAASGRIDLYGRLESQSALAAGEFRLRTVPQRLGQAAAANLQAGQGVPITDVQFEVIPLLSTPCDVYSMGVLAIRALLVGPDSKLPVAVDEVMSLAKAAETLAASAGGDTRPPLDRRIEQLLKDDPRWLQALGPQRLTTEPMTAQEALNVVPLALWSKMLAMIIRCFPGLSADSACADLGDARQGGVHLAYERLAEDLEQLLRTTRSLIVIDWNYNREIHAVVRKYAMGLAGAGQAPKRAGV
jgi:hypothetical protein